MTVRILLLNGVGSVGKSSIAKALQAIAAEPFLHIQMDAFLEMLPAAFQDHPDAFAFEAVHVEGKPEVIIRSGPVGERLMRGMRRAIAALAREGNNLIVDDVMSAEDRADYDQLLADFQVYAIGIFAPLEVLEARERERGDRLIGLARRQFGRVHEGMRYDLQIDASMATAQECAQTIKEKFGV